MLRDQPTFNEPSRLVRYIPPEFRNRNNRPAVGAYQKKENEDYLSVNSDELETVNQIAQNFASQFEADNRPVAVSYPTVANYNDAAGKVGVMISFNNATQNWEFREGAGLVVAYKHRSKKSNKSHCGIEYVRVFDALSDFRYAVRVARSTTYRMV